MFTTYQPFFGLDGKPITKSPWTHPYSYDDYVQWETSDFKYEECKVAWSDRLFQFDHKRYDNCCMEVWGNKGQVFSGREPEQIEYFLRLYLDQPDLKLHGIVNGCNSSSGYPYWIFFYKN